MRAHGIDDPESLLTATTTDRIVQTCNFGAREGWAKRLIVWKIKQGGIDPELNEPKVSTRDRFAHLTQHYSEGSVTESHKRLQRRRDYDEDCDGLLIVVEEPAFPSLVVRCDGCGYEAAYPFKTLAGGVLPDRPPVDPQPVPAAQPQVPKEQHRPAATYPSVRGVHPVRFDERSLRWRR
jgi:hypothetical protein